ncbi:glutathione hydrolase 3 isoform X1 [Ziziphus jujuba]|uniref:Glutathione hydrolase n=1 Tax=Ziziphus jujuba TaxID=326968 RepID=A0ABM3I5T1_ZIZJJ|nr:glutathione hydrolase 3 isoform X1 [Ziziphus jujuba]
MVVKQGLETPLLGSNGLVNNNNKRWRRRALWFILPLITLIIVGCMYASNTNSWVKREENSYNHGIKVNDVQIIESERGVVAADDGRCSEVGASVLRQGGHAVDAAVATALCLGVVSPMASGIGGGGFMIVRSSSTSQTEAYDLRETAPLAASENMYDDNPNARLEGPLSIGVPGEIAGLREAWLNHGRFPWRSLFQPAIKLAKDGFVIAPYFGASITRNSKKIMNDPGLRQVFAPKGKLLQVGETCYNVELGRTLEELAELGPQAFYNGTIGEKLVKDVREAGGILTMEDLKNYRVEVTDAIAADTMGYTIYGMPPPSSGTLGLSLVLNILESYGSPDAAKGSLGLHRLIEALKHMLSVRMNLGDPDFVNISTFASEMLSSDFAKQVREKIFDNTTFPPDYYLSRWSQLRDHGTSHFCIVDMDRNAVSMTTTVNYHFGAGLLSPSTGIVLNNEMGDFSIPTEETVDGLPPAPGNFIRPNKRPLSSMTPIIITKDNQLAGVIGGSGGTNIIPAVVQVFLNHFVLGMDPLAAVQNPRIYHKLIPNVVLYENYTVINGNHIELPEETRLFLQERGHQLKGQKGGAVTQLVVQNLEKPIEMGRKNGKVSNAQIFHGTLIAVSDLRKNGRPAAI